MSIKVTALEILGAPLEGENPLPFFRDRRHHRKIEVIQPFPEEKTSGLGYETGFRVLPYLMQDRFSRRRIPLKFKMVELENQYLKASFLPEVGGRLISLVDKTEGRELLSRNPVFQPANVAIRNAWVSGGIEWNIGQLGHTFSTSSPIFAAAVKGKDGQEFLRLYEFERCKRLFWQIDFHLPSGSKVLYAHTKVINPNPAEVPMYWWTNTAVPETLELRVFASAADVIYMDVAAQKKGFGYTRMPVLPSLPGKDFSYPCSCGFANEYFFQCPEMGMPWEAAVYKKGEMFFEVSTSRLRYRKMFCWGSHKGGRHWQEFLAESGTAYVEIQAGLAATQVHGLDMQGNTSWEWTQAFGGARADCGKAYSEDWFLARDHVEERIKSIISEQELYEKEAVFREAVLLEPRSVIHEGSGWGALENERMIYKGEGAVPSAFEFPPSTMGKEQAPWLHLLNNGRLPERDPGERPGPWMVQPEWKEILTAGLEYEENRNWYALLHAGVIAFEEGREEDAQGLWKESVDKRPSVWALRNLAAAAKVKGGTELALEYMQKAWEMPEIFSDRAFAEEYLTMLMDAGKVREAWKVFESMPEDIRVTERVSLLAGFAAIELRNLKFVEQLFERDFATIREGEMSLSMLWYKYHSARIADERGVKVDGKLMDEVKKSCVLPARLDFSSSED